MPKRHSRLKAEDISVQGAENLAHGIVRQAAKDYAREIRTSKKIGARPYELVRLEQFFNSEWGHLLCGDRGISEYITKKIRENPHIRRGDINSGHKKIN